MGEFAPARGPDSIKRETLSKELGMDIKMLSTVLSQGVSLFTLSLFFFIYVYLF